MKCPAKARRLLSRCERDDDITGLREAGALIEFPSKEPAAGPHASSLAPPCSTSGRLDTFYATSMSPNSPFAQSPSHVQAIVTTNAMVSPSSSNVQGNGPDGGHCPAEQTVTSHSDNQPTTIPLENPLAFHYTVNPTKPGDHNDYEDLDKTLSITQSDSQTLNSASRHNHSPQPFSCGSSPMGGGHSIGPSN